jgi:hypothetical protein
LSSLSGADTVEPFTIRKRGISRNPKYDAKAKGVCLLVIPAVNICAMIDQQLYDVEVAAA